MKRSIILSLFAVTLTALCATTVQATVNVQLNLFYEDPHSAGDPNAGGPVGGTWQLLVQSDVANGIAGIRFVLDGIDGVIGINDGNVNSNAAVWDEIDNIFKFRPTGVGTEVEIVAGDDFDGPLVLGVGTGAIDPNNAPGNIAVDDLRNSFWDHSALIADGAFGANGRPTIVSVEANEFDADPNSRSPAMIGTESVRGDAEDSLGIEVAGTGLYGGDVDRNGDVDTGDLSVLLTFFPLVSCTLEPGDPTCQNFAWDEGDVDSNDDVDTGDLSVLLTNFPLPPLNPGPALTALAAVPEPSSLVLLAVAGLGLAFRRRK